MNPWTKRRATAEAEAASGQSDEVVQEIPGGLGVQPVGLVGGPAHGITGDGDGHDQVALHTPRKWGPPESP